jgi:hypothetical protein
LINANHKDNKFRGIDIKRGQILTGRNKLSVETGLSERQVRTTLKNLQTTNEIIVESTTKYSIITLVNYNTYQSSDQPKDLVVSNKRPTSDQRATTNNNDNNEKNDKNILVNDFFEELKNILSKNYSGTISTKLPTKKSKDKLSLLLKKKEIIIIGYTNYIKMCKNENRELKFIKSLDVFLNQETYLDYQELNIKKENNVNILTAEESWD